MTDFAHPHHLRFLSSSLCPVIDSLSLLQAPRPKAKAFKGDLQSHHPLELLACDRQSQAGHMLLNLSSDAGQLVNDVVEAFRNKSGQNHLIDKLFGSQTQEHLSFISNDDISSINARVPDNTDLIKWDNGNINHITITCVLLCCCRLTCVVVLQVQCCVTPALFST